MLQGVVKADPEGLGPGSTKPLDPGSSHGLDPGVEPCRDPASRGNQAGVGSSGRQGSGGSGGRGGGVAQDLHGTPYEDVLLALLDRLKWVKGGGGSVVTCGQLAAVLKWVGDGRGGGSGGVAGGWGCKWAEGGWGEERWAGNSW